MAPLTHSTFHVSGELAVPGDKSISHRALIFSALGSGVSRVRRILQSADVQSTAAVLRSLGVSIPDLDASMEIARRGTRLGLRSPRDILDCGNSGTTARLWLACSPAIRFDRPLYRRREPQPASHAPCRTSARGHGRAGRADQQGGLPMTVHGGPLTGRLDQRDVQCAGEERVLLAGVLRRRPVTTVREPTRSRDHTERMFAAHGVGAWVNEDARHCYSQRGRSHPLDLDVPGDPSSAAFFAALAALAPEAELSPPHVCANPTRTRLLSALAGWARLSSSRMRETRAVNGRRMCA